MFNFDRINESVAAAAKQFQKKPVVEAEGEKPKRIDVKVTTKDGDHWTTGFNGTAEEAKSYFMGKRFEKMVKGKEQKGEPVVKVEVLGESEDDAKAEIEKIKGEKADNIKNQPEGHDEEKEIEEDPTREKLETSKDEADERKGGPAELAADLRVSIRIEKMGIGRYKRMLAKHELSPEDEKWLKGRIDQIQGEIETMEKKIPELEAEAAEGKTKDEAKAEIKEHMIASIRKAVIEMVGG
jgi:hypothetical protein